MSQPEDILSDFAKAKAMRDDKNRIPDRFGDDVDHIQFWVNMATILHGELVKALENASVNEPGRRWRHGDPLPFDRMGD